MGTQFKNNKQLRALRGKCQNCKYYSKRCEEINFKASKFEDNYKYNKDTLCWCCKRSTERTCSWSEKFIPVEGWNAEERILHYGVRNQQETTSYIVKECPLFIRG